MDMINDYCGVARDSRGIATLTICNAGSLNILNSKAIAGLRTGIQALAADHDIRVLIIRGTGEKSMIGGADIKEMATLNQATAEKFISGLRDLCEAVRQFPVPVIARIPGWCLGGGLEFAAACDLRVATASSKFGMPEVKVGIPSVIHAALLPRLIGWGRARWLILTADTIDAPTARTWGLVDKVVPDDELDAAVDKAAAAIAECGPAVIRSQKMLLRQWEDIPLDEAIDISVGVFGRAFLTGEPQRHMQAFIDRKR
ncbi:enoyl-CoA hydratase [Afipia sp. Root123D2]|uniref:enoyl-CoA hydratase n=1 Tax=Afipia sp. Root123D2 TaxID=1736436 RepID=UPI000701C631|nr:enoyl-CoA hydratase [Afipia sp. Root123D2]KQW23331.1 enoyl-CoA hydratase [Afipia sp. Root123D2]